jgi:hypothetical protein
MHSSHLFGVDRGFAYYIMQVMIYSWRYCECYTLTMKIDLTKCGYGIFDPIANKCEINLIIVIKMWLCAFNWCWKVWGCLSSMNLLHFLGPCLGSQGLNSL